MLDVADMSAREVDNDEVVCIDGLLRRDKDIRCNVWSEEWKTTRDDGDGANDSIITTPTMKKIHNTPRVEEDIIMTSKERGRGCGFVIFKQERRVCSKCPTHRPFLFTLSLT